MKILVWIEPIFIRDSMVTYEWIATRFAHALQGAIMEDPAWRHQARIFCNRATLERVRPHAGGISECLLTSTDQEEARLRESFVPWADEGRRRWISHMTGDAEYCDGYVQMLERVHSEFAFDAIVVWGTNGIVNGYARANGVLPLFLELGPIRQPFVATGVIDSRGVNGDSRIAVGELAWDSAPDREVLRPLHENLRPGRWASAPSGSLLEPYAVVPLQTADDANILVHNHGMSYDQTIYNAVRKISDTGMNCVVKTHPGAQSCPFNASAQERLVKTLSGLPRVVVLDRIIGGGDYARLLLNASAVATFNSSLGFEASLLGIPTHVMAPAGYAPPGKFAELEEICGGMPGGEIWLSRMARLHRMMTERYLLQLDDIFNFQVLRDAAWFWKQTELSSPTSAGRKSVAIMQVIKRIFSPRHRSQPGQSSEQLSPLGIRWPGP